MGTIATPAGAGGGAGVYVTLVVVVVDASLLEAGAAGGDDVAVDVGFKVKVRIPLASVVLVGRVVVDVVDAGDVIVAPGSGFGISRPAVAEAV